VNLVILLGALALVCGAVAKFGRGGVRRDPFGSRSAWYDGGGFGGCDGGSGDGGGGGGGCGGG
jgi:hypothetical protein